MTDAQLTALRLHVRVTYGTQLDVIEANGAHLLDLAKQADLHQIPEWGVRRCWLASRMPHATLLSDWRRTLPSDSHRTLIGTPVLVVSGIPRDSIVVVAEHRAVLLRGPLLPYNW